MKVPFHYIVRIPLPLHLRENQGVKVICLALVLFCAPMLQAEKWMEYRTGPFRVYSNAGDKAARERLTEMEQMRFVLQGWIGKDSGRAELQSVWPLHLVLFDTAKEQGPYALPQAFANGGSAVWSVWNGDTAQPLDWKLELAARLIEDNAGRLPRGLEDALATMIATLKINVTRIEVGAPPPVELQTKDWMRMHYFVTTPEFAGRFRIYLNNLQQGGDEALAVRNSFNLSLADLDQRLKDHTDFSTVPIPGKPLNPVRDFVERPVTDVALKAMLGELKIAGKSFDTDSPRGLVAKNTRPALELAATANPRWAEPHFRLAQIETNPLAKVKELKLATSLEPRNASYWQALAEAQTVANQLPDSSRSWASAELAAATPEERDKIRTTRRAAEEKRTEVEIAERRQQADERAQELDRLKKAAAAEIHAAEDAANAAQGGLKPGSAPIAWWSDEKGIAVNGTLTKVECLRESLKLTISAASGNILVLVRDPKKIAVRGAEQATFACGSPRPAPKIALEHNGKPDTAFGTAGDVIVVEFP